MSFETFSQIENLNTYFSGSIDNIKKNIYDHNTKNTNKISYKIKDNLLLIFNDFVKISTKYEIFNNARSLVLSKNENGDYKTIAYTHPVIDYNNSEKLSSFNETNFIECFEGTLLSIYYTDNSWKYSTRKCIDAKDSFLNINGKISSKSHFDMFLETINSLNEFESNLDIAKSYYFVLVHHENKTFITYADKFGENYKKLILLFVRDASLNKVVISDNDYVKQFDYSSVKYTLDQVKEKILSDTNVMGYLVNEKENNGKNLMYVYHTNFYSNLEKITPYSASYESMLIELYKNNNLDLHFSKYPENIKYKGTQFDTKGVMYSIFTYLGMTSLNLYYFFTVWKDDKLTHKNENEFKILFGEEKNLTLQTMLYKMKGVVIAEKKKIQLDDVKKILKYYISTNDIIRCLKEFEAIKTNHNQIFMKMNQKYTKNDIVAEFIKNV
jgi:hypothetical protein